MAIKTLFVNTIKRTKAAEKVTQDDGVIRAKSTPQPVAASDDSWRLYFQLESKEQVERLHKRLEDIQQAGEADPIPEGMEGHYYH